MYCFYPRVEIYALTALDAVRSIGRNQRGVHRRYVLRCCYGRQQGSPKSSDLMKHGPHISVDRTFKYPIRGYQSRRATF
jgi:hypothetical protein